MSGEVQTVGAGNSWVEYGVKNLKTKERFYNKNRNENNK